MQCRPKKEIFHEEEEPDKSPQFFTQAEESTSPKRKQDISL